MTQYVVPDFAFGPLSAIDWIQIFLHLQVACASTVLHPNTRVYLLGQSELKKVRTPVFARLQTLPNLAENLHLSLLHLVQDGSTLLKKSGKIIYAIARAYTKGY
jgi:hypothetical protein